MASSRPHFVSAQPDTVHFVWQTHVYVKSFLDVGIEEHEITALFGVEPGRAPSPELAALRRRFPNVDIRTIEDDRDDRGRSYAPSIQPHLIEKWLHESPERQRAWTFFHDCDIAFRRLPDFESMQREHPDACVLSDAIPYIGYDYLHDRCELIRNERGDVRADDLIIRMCDVVGIDLDTVRANHESSGGAQYLLTNVGPEYWAKVYRDSVSLRRLFDEYAAELGLAKDPSEYIQVWTAGMWAYLWNLWALGRTTAVHPEMAFLFGTERLDEHTPIIHMAGAPAAGGALFNKNDWSHLDPVATVVRQPYLFDHFPVGSVSAAYAERIHAAAGTSPAGVCEAVPAAHWRVLAWEAGPHRAMWDLELLHFVFDNDAAVVEHLESGSAGPGYQAERAFAPNDSFWGGRPQEQPGVQPALYLGVVLDKPAVPTMVTLIHAATEHIASLVTLQYSVDGSTWATTRVARLAADRRAHTLVYRPTSGAAAQAWRLTGRDISHDFAWDVSRVRILGSDREETGVWSSSGHAAAGFEVANVTADDATLWGGRADDAGRFHLTLSDTTGLAIDRIILEQGDRHWARSLEVEALDDGGTWRTLHRFDRLVPGHNDLFLREQPPVAMGRKPPAESKRFVRCVDRFSDRRILVLIAAYRDPELAHTISNALAQAAYPEHVRFAVCHQFDDLTVDVLAPWSDDPRFSIDALPYTESRGCCWARARTFDLFDDEPYVLQIDAHTRFAARWDERYIDMLESTGAELPVLTSYPPRYTIDDDGKIVYDVDAGVQRLIIAELRADLTTLQKTAPAPTLAEPGPSPTIAAGQIFTRGRFIRDVPYDPDMYFAGEEISLAARAFTSGYDLFYPNENLVWHLYQHVHPKHWDDHRDHSDSHQVAVARLKTLFQGDTRALGRYGLGRVRSLAAFEKAAGVRLRDRRQGAADGLVIEIDRSVIEQRDDYRAFVIVFLDRDGREVARTELRSPDVLDLSRSSVTLHELDPGAATDYLVVPTRRNGAVGEVALRRL